MAEVEVDKPKCDCGRIVRFMPDGQAEPCRQCQPNQYRQAWREYEQTCRQKRVERLIQSSGFSPRYREKTFENFRIEGPGETQMLQLRDRCRDFADNFEEHVKRGKWMLFYGPCGTGKGHLAAAIGNQIMRENKGAVLFRKYIELVSQIKTAWRGEGDLTETQIIEATRACDLLILDEIGVQFDTNAERVLLYRILDYRYEHLRPMILTTNLTEKQLEKVAGVRVLDRLYEEPNEILFFNWPSYRRRSS